MIFGIPGILYLSLLYLDESGGFRYKEYLTLDTGGAICYNGHSRRVGVSSKE